MAVSGFRLREGNEIGCRVTLRGKRMYEFLDRLISVALPRIRDFRGVNPKSFDGHGNYSLGLAEQMVFPEIDPDKVTFTQGMDITFVTSTSNDDEARELLRRLRHAVPRGVTASSRGRLMATDSEDTSNSRQQMAKLEAEQKDPDKVEAARRASRSASACAAGCAAGPAPCIASSASAASASATWPATA